MSSLQALLERQQGSGRQADSTIPSSRWAPSGRSFQRAGGHGDGGKGGYDANPVNRSSIPPGRRAANGIGRCSGERGSDASLAVAEVFLGRLIVDQTDLTAVAQPLEGPLNSAEESDEPFMELFSRTSQVLIDLRAAKEELAGSKGIHLKINSTIIMPRC
jgi:hypothetical protein